MWGQDSSGHQTKLRYIFVSFLSFYFNLMNYTAIQKLSYYIFFQMKEIVSLLVNSLSLRPFWGLSKLLFSFFLAKWLRTNLTLPPTAYQILWLPRVWGGGLRAPPETVMIFFFLRLTTTIFLKCFNPISHGLSDSVAPTGGGLRAPPPRNH